MSNGNRFPLKLIKQNNPARHLNRGYHDQRCKSRLRLRRRLWPLPGSRRYNSPGNAWASFTSVNSKPLGEPVAASVYPCGEAMALRIRPASWLGRCRVERRVGRALWMILVNNRGAEQREIPVADRLHDVTVIAMDGIDHHLERRINNRVRFLWAGGLHQLRRAFDVGEQPGDGLALAAETFRRRYSVACTSPVSPFLPGSGDTPTSSNFPHSPRNRLPRRLSALHFTQIMALAAHRARLML
jgi:hypothetical protein